MVELRFSQNTNYRKDNVDLLRAAGGKLGKPKDNFKVHLFGGISRHGLTPLVIFTGRMFSQDFQNYLSVSILPFIRSKLPYGHKFFMDFNLVYKFAVGGNRGNRGHRRPLGGVVAIEGPSAPRVVSGRYCILEEFLNEQIKISYELGHF